MGIRDWLGGGRRPEPTHWQVHVEGGDLVVLEVDRKTSRRYPVHAAHSVRVVPLTGGNHHAGGRGGWQVTLSRDDGDLLVESAMRDWRPAQALARQMCEATGLPLDELTARLFSQTGLPQS